MSNVFWKSALAVSVCVVALSSGVSGQSDLQRRFDTLVPGVTSLDQVKSLFGKPASEELGIEWEAQGDGSYQMVTGRITTHADDSGKSRRHRFLHQFEYPALGLRFSFFDQPYQLESVRVESPNISLYELRIGNSMKQVIGRLGANEAWHTSDVDDLWWLEYTNEGVRFGFPRDKGFPKYPMRLKSPNMIVKIEKFDARVSFF